MLGRHFEAQSNSSSGRAPSGLARYVVALLRRGPTFRSSAGRDAERDAAQHRTLLDRLRENGEIIAEGPVDGSDEIVEMVLFRTSSIATARSLLQPDPMISSGQLLVELRTWTVPEGLRVGENRTNPTDLDFTTD